MLRKDEKENPVSTKILPPETTIPLKNLMGTETKTMLKNLIALLHSKKFNYTELALIADYCDAGIDPEFKNEEGKSPLQIAVASENFHVLKLFLLRCKPMSISGLGEALKTLVKENLYNLKFLIYFQDHPDKTEEGTTLKRSITNKILLTLLENATTAPEITTLKNYLIIFKNKILYYSEKRSSNPFKATKNVDSKHWILLFNLINAKLENAYGVRKADKGMTLFDNPNMDIKHNVKSNPKKFGYGRLE